MMPKAPGLFSITMGWPRIGRMCSPTMRMTMSVALPGPNGTTTLTGFDGYLSWAATSTPPKAKSMVDNNRRSLRFMLSSHVVRSSHAQAALPQDPAAPTGVGQILVRQLDLHLGDDFSPCRKLAREP